MKPYGNYFAGDALYNLRIGIYGIEGAFRFIAKDTVPVNKIRYFNTYSFEKPGYHAGTGGKIRIEIQEDENTFPSGRVLSSAFVESPITKDPHLLVDFDKTVVLEKGKIYHIVFTNYDVNPEINYVSIDMMAVFASKPVNVPDQPELDLVDMTTLCRDKYNKTWRRFKANQAITPIFTMFYSVSDVHTDNVSVVGYGSMESWVREFRYIQGGHSVRQRFVPAKDIPVKDVAIRLAKTGNPNNLKVTLSLGNSILEQGEISSSLVKTVNTTTLSGFRIGHDWVKHTFSDPFVLEKNKEYYLTLSADAGDAYEIFPLRDGSSFGYASTWDNAWAEYLVPGKTWSGWDAWGNKNLKLGDLQLYFNSKI